MSAFARLYRADQFLDAVVRKINSLARQAGPDEAWHYDPEYRESRERAVRVLTRAVNHYQRAAERDRAERGTQSLTQSLTRSLTRR